MSFTKHEINEYSIQINVFVVYGDEMFDRKLLTDCEREGLDRDGYVVLADVITLDLAQKMALRVDEVLSHVPERDIHDDFVNRDPIFDVCFSTPRVLAAVAHVIGGDFKLSSLHSREPLSGQDAQGLHSDWEQPARDGRYTACNTIWVLDDFTEDNGPTRIVPGSHRTGQLPEEMMHNTKDVHLKEVKVLATSGSVVVFNAHVWHGGTARKGEGRRRALFAFFCRRDLPQQDDQRALVLPETYARLSAEMRHLLDL